MGQSVSAAVAASRGESQPPSPPPVPQDSSTTTAKGPDAEFVRVFHRLDANRDGLISATEIQGVFGCTDTEAREMIASVDSNKDGVISIEELWVLLQEGESDGLRSAFAVYDENKDGMISAEELCGALRRVLGEKDLTVEQCALMIAGVDKDGDGFISFDEFKVMMAT